MYFLSHLYKTPQLMNVEYSLFYSATILSRSANKADYINEWGCQLPNVFFSQDTKACLCLWLW